MVQILSPTGIEKPEGVEKHSRAQILRNLDRTNAIEVARRANSGIPFGHAGVISGNQTMGGTDKAVVIKDQVLRGGMTFDNTAGTGGRLVIPRPGLYEIRIKAYVRGGSAYDFMFAPYVDSVVIGAGRIFSHKVTTSDYMLHSTCTWDLIAGQRIGLGATTPQQTWGVDGYDGAWLEVEFKME